MRTLIAIPVFNEEKYVRRVIEKVLEYGHDVLVVDDGSTDETPHILPTLPVDLIRHAENRGYGRSIRDAFRWSISEGYDWLITMDCDEQHEPASIPEFVAAAQQADLPDAIEHHTYADIISGTRYATRSDRAPVLVNGAPPPERRAINHAITEELNARLADSLGTVLSDAFCGFKAYRVETLKLLRPTVNGYAFPMQFWAQAAAHRLAVRELPVRLIYNDPNRSFGAVLDNPVARLTHYRRILHRELRRHSAVLPAESGAALVEPLPTRGVCCDKVS